MNSFFSGINSARHVFPSNIISIMFYDLIKFNKNTNKFGGI